MSIRERVREGGLFDGLYRYPRRGWVAGVCQGLGRYFGWNVKLIRVLAILGLVFSGFFPLGLIYVALWYLMDEAPDEAYGNWRWRPHRRHRGHRHDQDPEPEPDLPPAGGAATMTDVKARFARMEQRLRSMEECVSSRDFELRRELKKLEG